MFPTEGNEPDGHQGAALCCTILIFILSYLCPFRSILLALQIFLYYLIKMAGGDKNATFSTEFPFNLFIQSLYEVHSSIELGQLIHICWSDLVHALML